MPPDRKPYCTGKQILVSTILLGRRELLLRYRGKEKKGMRRRKRRREREKAEEEKEEGSIALQNITKAL